MHFKRFFQHIQQDFRQAISRFREAVCLNFLLFVLLSHTLFGSWHKFSWISMAAGLAIGMVFAVLLALLYEQKKPAPRDHLVRGILVAAFTVLCYCLIHIGMSPVYLGLLLAGGISAMCWFILALLSRQQVQAGVFPQLLFLAVRELIVSAVLVGVMGVCLLAFDVLIMDVFFTWYLELALFCFGVVGFQLFLADLPRLEEHVVLSVWMDRFLVRALFPVYLIFLLILYIYIVKILLAWSMPVGTMNRFASLAVLGYAVFYFSQQGKAAGRYVDRFLHWGILVLMPILIVQFIGIWQRYSAYGLTSLRVLSLLCILYGIATLLMGFFRCAPYRLFLALGIGSLVFTMTPLNIVDLASRDQQARLMSVLKEAHMLQDGEIVEGEPLTRKQDEVFASSYSYLEKDASEEHFAFVQQVRDSIVLQDMLYEKVPGKASTQEKAVVSVTFSLPKDASFAVAGYSQMETFKLVDKNANQLNITTADGTALTYDLQSFANQLWQTYGVAKTEKNGRLRLEVPCLQLDLPDGSRLYFQQCKMSCAKAGEDVRLSGTGFWLCR